MMNKRSSRLIAWLLTMMMIFNIAPTSAFAGAQSGGWETPSYAVTDISTYRDDGAPNENNRSFTVKYVVSGQYTSLEQYAREYYLKQFSDNFNNLEPEYNQDGSLKRNNLKIDDRDAVTFQYKATFAGEEYSFRAWLISDSGYVYTVLYTAKSDVYENHLSYAELIAENIRFK